MLSQTTLRILDANANRAREALRVLEDYARFALDDDALSHALKNLRHDLAGAVGPYLPAAILHRDTVGDVGTDNKTAAEGHRPDLAAVVIAAGKRLGEALRVLEELLKTHSAAEGLAVEAMRYGFYTLEQRIARTLRPATRFADVRLYVLITESACTRPWLEAAEEAILGGADCLQLREKGLEGGELLRRAEDFVALCRRHGVLSIINDRPDVALLAKADGVHVGQGDLPAEAVRRVLGPEKVVGVSTHNIEQARQAVRDGADYIGVGPFFRSPTKPRDFTAGPAYARAVAVEIKIPAVAIAGITAANVGEVLATGIPRVAVTAAVVGAADVRAAARGMKERLANWDGAVAPDVDGPDVRTRRRHLPHWTMAGGTYFLTFRAAAAELAENERTIVLAHVRQGHGRFYTLLAAVVMPEHAHALLRPNDGVELSRIMKGIKGVSARLINTARGSAGRVWQDESWDRIVRDQAELDEKLQYVLNNPVKRELVNDPWDYPWTFIRDAE